MKDQKYAVENEFDGFFVGTLEEIEEWCVDQGINIFQSTFYELGDQVTPHLKVN